MPTDVHVRYWYDNKNQNENEKLTTPLRGEPEGAVNGKQ